MSPYNHSHILRSETLEKANEELCRRLTRRTNDLPMLHESGNSADAGKIKVEGSQHSAVPDGTNFTEVRLWKLVSKLGGDLPSAPPTMWHVPRDATHGGRVLANFFQPRIKLRLSLVFLFLL